MSEARNEENGFEIAKNSPKLEQIAKKKAENSKKTWKMHGKWAKRDTKR
jgi:hypothetical protein